MVNQCEEFIKKGRYMTSREKFALLRVVPFGEPVAMRKGEGASSGVLCALALQELS